jgi:hypothetical protein
MEFGDLWGSTWGGPLPIIENHAQLAVWDLPDYLQDETRLTAFVAMLAERWQTNEYFVRNVEPYLVMDYERANGVWLDQIGSFLNVPRLERDDDYYRRVLKAYATVVHPRRRTTEGLLSALVALINDEAGVEYSPAYPKGFFLQITGLGTDDQLTWDALKIVDLATPATYNRQVRILPDNPLLYVDSLGEAAIVTDGLRDSLEEVPGPYGELAWIS